MWLPFTHVNTRLLPTRNLRAMVLWDHWQIMITAFPLIMSFVAPGLQRIQVYIKARILKYHINLGCSCSGHCFTSHGSVELVLSWLKKAIELSFNNIMEYISIYLSHVLCWLWLAKNREVYTRISRLTPSSWVIKRKEHHWWRHNGDHGGPLLLPLRWDRGNTVFIQRFRLDKMNSWDFKDAETF